VAEAVRMRRNVLLGANFSCRLESEASSSSSSSFDEVDIHEGLPANSLDAVLGSGGFVEVFILGELGDGGCEAQLQMMLQAGFLLTKKGHNKLRVNYVLATGQGQKERLGDVAAAADKLMTVLKNCRLGGVAQRVLLCNFERKSWAAGTTADAETQSLNSLLRKHSGEASCLLVSMPCITGGSRTSVLDRAQQVIGGLSPGRQHHGGGGRWMQRVAGLVKGMGPTLLVGVAPDAAPVTTNAI